MRKAEIEVDGDWTLDCCKSLAGFIASMGEHRGEAIRAFHEWLGEQQDRAVKDYGWQILVRQQARLATHQDLIDRLLREVNDHINPRLAEMDNSDRAELYHKMIDAMDGAWRLAELPRYEKELARREEAAEADERMAGGVGNNGVPRIRRAINLLKLGVEPVDVQDGLLLNDKIIVAVNKNKYRHTGRGQWLEFKRLEDVVNIARQ